VAYCCDAIELSRLQCLIVVGLGLFTFQMHSGLDDATWPFPGDGNVDETQQKDHSPTLGWKSNTKEAQTLGSRERPRGSDRLPLTHAAQTEQKAAATTATKTWKPTAGRAGEDQPISLTYSATGFLLNVLLALYFRLVLTSGFKAVSLSFRSASDSFFGTPCFFFLLLPSAGGE